MAEHELTPTFYALGLATGSPELDTQCIKAEWLLAEAGVALDMALECDDGTEEHRETIAQLRADLADIQALADFVADSAIAWRQADRPATAH